MKRTLLLLVVMGFTASASAQQFRWVDKDGRVQYGDTPPPGVKATRLKPPPSGSAPAPSSAAKKDGEKPLSPDAAFRKRQQEKEEADKKASQQATDAETRRMNCVAAQAEVRSIEGGHRISTTDKSGERVYLDDDQRGRELERARRAAASWCG
jgi:hypothetical protein